MYLKKALRQQYEAKHSTYHKYGYRKNTCRRLHLIDAYTVVFMSSCLSKVRQIQKIAMQGDFSTNNFTTHRKLFNPSKL